MGNKIMRRRPAIDDRHTRPQGLYPSRDVDQRKLRRLILDAKLAPCYPGGEEPAVELEECPICFLHYPSLNRSKCCTKGICTECFLQVKSPNGTRPTQCPYCKMANYSVDYRGPKSMEEKGVEQAEEQKVIEAKIRMRQQELQDDEEREHRRDDDIRDSSAPPHHPIPSLADALTHDSEQDNWQAWETISHPSQVSFLSEYTEPDNFVSRLWPHKTKTSKPKAGQQPKLDPAYHQPRPMENLKCQGYDCSKALASVSYGAFEKAHSWMWHHQTLENLSPLLLSQSFPPPSRMPDYHCREIRVMEPPNLLSCQSLPKMALGDDNTPNMLSRHPLLKTALGADRRSCVVEVKSEEIQNMTGPLSSGVSEIPVLAMETDSSWLQGTQQHEADDDDDSRAPQLTVLALAPQQGVPTLRNHGFPTPQAPPGAQLTSGAPTSVFSRHNRDDEFDLDLEDIMVMEAIWLSIQEQGAQHRYTDDEPHMSTPSGSSPILMTNFSLSSDGDADLGEIILPPPPPPPPLLPVPPPPSALDIQEQAPGRRNSVTGGLASAIAALAERQVAGGDTTTTRQSILSILPPEPATVSQRKEVNNSGTNLLCEIPYGEEPFETADSNEPLQRKRNGLPVLRKIGCSKVGDSASEDERGVMLATSEDVDFWKSQREGEHGSPRIRDSSENPSTSEGLANWVSSTQQEYVTTSMTKSSGDQSSEQVEVGTSFSSSIPSASELPWEAPEIRPDGRNGEGSSSEEAGGKSAVVPESFEEQMMLAMALSLAEAQANSRGHRDDGSLTQQSSNVQ